VASPKALPAHFVNRVFKPFTDLTDRQRKQRQQQLLVKETEWSVFAGNDATLLFNAYEVLRKEALYMAPVMMVLKFIVVAPAIMLDAGVGQLSLLAVGAMLYGVWIQLQGPFRSRWIGFMEIAGVCHQIAQIGFQGFYTAQANDKDIAVPLQSAMFGSTIAYLIVVFGLILGMILRPILTELIDGLRKKHHFERLGLNDFAGVPVYLEPVEEHTIRREREPDEVTEATVNSEPDSDDEGGSGSDSDSSVSVSAGWKRHTKGAAKFDPSLLGAALGSADFTIATEEAIRNTRREMGIDSDSDGDDAAPPRAAGQRAQRYAADPLALAVPMELTAADSTPTNEPSFAETSLRQSRKSPAGSDEKTGAWSPTQMAGEAGAAGTPASNEPFTAADHDTAATATNDVEQHAAPMSPVARRETRRKKRQAKERDERGGEPTAASDRGKRPSKPHRFADVAPSVFKNAE
jgi:hypothetical protein